MIAPIKQLVTVGADGNIIIRNTELAPGTQAEVTVVVGENRSAPQGKPMTQGEAFLALQASMNLSREAGEKWMAENRELRQWNRPRE